MDCPICRNLEQAFNAGLREYTEARSSACYQVSKRFAAIKNVDMERARYELEEHRLVCATTVRAVALVMKRNVSLNLKLLAT